MKKQLNPEIDFGFYAGVPRLVRTGYKTTPDGQRVTHTQKWFYTCLKDLCGDSGTCYRTVRSLAEETDLSIGLVSESIPILHAAGLIHATKKKRSTGGKEVWHITIVDIWPANGKAHPTKKVPVQDTNNVDGNVHKMNMNVQDMNKDPEECSQNEHECSQIRYRRKNNKARTIEERTIKQERENTPVVFNSPPQASDDAPSLSFLHPELTFLSFDDLINPTQMQLELVPDSDPYWSELDYKHRTRTASELHYELEQKLHHPVAKRIKYVPTVFDATVEASPPVENNSPVESENDSHSYSHTSQIRTSQPAQEDAPAVPQEVDEVKPKRAKPEKQQAAEKRMREIFALFDGFFAEKLEDPAYKVDRASKKNKDSVKGLVSQNATDEGIRNTWESIKAAGEVDEFWRNKLTISCVNSQYANRCKVAKPGATIHSRLRKQDEEIEHACKIARGELPLEEIPMVILQIMPRDLARVYNQKWREHRRAEQLKQQQKVSA